MNVLFPSQDWADAIAAAITNSKDTEEHGKNWGVGFNGSFLFEISPGSGLDKDMYFYMDLKQGKASDAVMKPEKPTTIDPGFVITGSYGDWKLIVSSKLDLMEAIIKGTFTVRGDMGKIMRNAKFVRAVANLLSTIQTSYLGE